MWMMVIQAEVQRGEVAIVKLRLARSPPTNAVAMNALGLKDLSCLMHNLGSDDGADLSRHRVSGGSH